MQPDPKRGETRRNFAVQRAILAMLLAGDPVARTLRTRSRIWRPRSSQAGSRGPSELRLARNQRRRVSVAVADERSPRSSPAGGMVSVQVARRFGENLRQRRKRAGLSQEDLGVRAGLHRTAIGLLERGARTPRIDTLVKLSTALDIPPAELIEGIVWKPGEASPGRFTLSGELPSDHA